jgi:hypothetical protein
MAKGEGGEFVPKEKEKEKTYFYPAESSLFNLSTQLQAGYSVTQIHVLDF